MIDDPLLVVPDLGDPLDTSLAEVLVTTGWMGAVATHAHPGTGTAPAPVGGNHDLADAAFDLAGLDVDAPPVLVGQGRSGTAVQLLGLGGRARAVVIVDGLGGPWSSPDENVGTWRDRLRALAADDEALGSPSSGVLDPRFRYPPPPHRSRSFAASMLAEMPVPILVVETLASPVEVEDAEQLVSEATNAQLRQVDVSHLEVARSIVAWAGAVSS